MKPFRRKGPPDAATMRRLIQALRDDVPRDVVAARFGVTEAFIRKVAAENQIEDRPKVPRRDVVA